MKTELYTYQKKIKDTICGAEDYSRALFMSMGSGKTITSLSIFEDTLHKKKTNKLLVVCLKNKIKDWKEDIEKEFSDSPPFEYEVINFESIWRAKRIDYYRKFVDDKCFIIIDESQKIKNYKSKVSKFLLELSTHTKYKLILTGTPQNQQYIDYYPQMKFINSPIYDISFKLWEKEYVNKRLDSIAGRHFYIIESYNKTKILNDAIIDKAHYYDWSGDYDAPVEITENIEHSRDALKFQKDKVWLDPDPVRADDVIADTQMALRIYMRQSCSGFIRNYDIDSPKEEWLKDFLEIETRRVVIFVNFIHEIDKIKKLCEKVDRPCGVYFGAEKNLKPFEDNENGVIVVNYQSGAVGLNNLCIANVGIFYSPPEDHILFAQAKARLDRIGQTKQPVFYFLSTVGSVERAIYKSLKMGEDFDQRQFDSWLEKQK